MHPVERRGEPLGAHRLEEVVDGADLVGVDRPVVVRGDEHHRRRHGHRVEHPGELQPVQPGHADVEEDDLDVAALGHPHARHRVDARRPADRPARRGRLAHPLTAVQDAQRVRGVRRLEHGAHPGVLASAGRRVLRARVARRRPRERPGRRSCRYCPRSPHPAFRSSASGAGDLRVRLRATMVTAKRRECQRHAPFGYHSRCVPALRATDRTVPMSRGSQPPGPSASTRSAAVSRRQARRCRAGRAAGLRPSTGTSSASGKRSASTARGVPSPSTRPAPAPGRRSTPRR